MYQPFSTCVNRERSDPFLRSCAVTYVGQSPKYKLYTQVHLCVSVCVCLSGNVCVKLLILLMYQNSILSYTLTSFEYYSGISIPNGTFGSKIRPLIDSSYFGRTRLSSLPSYLYQGSRGRYRVSILPVSLLGVLTKKFFYSLTKNKIIITVVIKLNVYDKH